MQQLFCSSEMRCRLFETPLDPQLAAASQQLASLAPDGVQEHVVILVVPQQVWVLYVTPEAVVCVAELTGIQTMFHAPEVAFMWR
jgi:hypothetical protein